MGNAQAAAQPLKNGHISKGLKVRFRAACLSALFLPVVAVVGRGAEIIYIHGPNPDPVAQEQLDLTARFYGLDLDGFQVRTRSQADQALRLLRRGDTLAAVISADALPALPREATLAALRRLNAKSVPLLILSITPRGDMRQMPSWSDGAVLDCHPLPAAVSASSYVVGNGNQITGELADEELPNLTPAGCSLTTGKGSNVEPLISLRDGKQNRAVFVWAHSGSQEVCLLAGMAADNSAGRPRRREVVSEFSRLAPVMMFVRHAAGENAWHSDGHYANLTIDDAWLREPYGHLDYAALLGEMEAHNFHTTIAFIPWNFDRSEPKVVQLFRSHLDRFSICIHGNNHDHLEFGAYDRTPLSGQIADIQQGLARMERFRALTSLPVGRVMIFPDEVAPPVPTLRALERYNFVGAANADVVPLGSVQPTEALFFLRAVNLKFTNFPVVRRYSADAGVSKALIAINAFLDNPLLFYGHQSLFTKGIDAFDPVAAAVNQIQPDTRWDSLGSIAQHLYLVKVRPDGNYDAISFASDFILHNRLQRELIYYVEKEEDESLPIKSLTIDGRPSSYDLSGRHLRLAVPLGAGESKHIVIEYQSDLNLASVDVSKKSLRVAFLRRISDFRDITMSQSALGRALTNSYYQHHLDDAELEIERSLSIILALLVLGIAAGWLLRKRTRTRDRGTA